MPVFYEFLLVAFLIYLWESVLWLPKYGVALRRGWFSRKWRVIRADRMLSMRELGMVPLLPIISDPHIAPCFEFPLAVNSKETIFVKSPDGWFQEAGMLSREQIRYEAPYLLAGNHKARCQSPVIPAAFSKAFPTHNTSVDNAIRHVWKLSLSPSRARLNLRKWQLASESLRFYCPLLTIGFFVGIPATYLTLGSAAAIWVGLWLWCLMLTIAIRLFWIGKRVYPSARAAIRQDALLSLLVPFHAMRAMEICSVHAFATTHPAAILLASGQTTHPWFSAFIRQLIHPRPSVPGDQALTETALPILKRHLSRQERDMAEYLRPPDRSTDPEAVAWCPRCHGMFTEGTSSCRDCGGIELERFELLEATSEP